VLVMAALAICAVTAALLRHRTDTQAPAPVHPDQPPPAGPGMTPLTVPEITRLLTTQPARLGLAEHWADWRRGHQARARWYHHRARLARDPTTALVSWRQSRQHPGSLRALVAPARADRRVAPQPAQSPACPGWPDSVSSAPGRARDPRDHPGLFACGSRRRYIIWHKTSAVVVCPLVTVATPAARHR
jgi:hypothetical protein